jgi:hypothetical protein
MRVHGELPHSKSEFAHADDRRNLTVELRSATIPSHIFSTMIV